MPTDLIDLHELKIWLDQRREFVLLDTSLQEDFAAAHLPGAQNACVYEVNFLDQVNALEGLRVNPLARLVGGGPRHDVPVVVYGSSEGSLASATAAEKLLAAGFTAISDFRGGLAAWQAARLPLEGTGETPALVPLEDRAYTVDPAECTVEWAGRNLASKHHGTIRLLPGGAITLRNGRLAEGHFEIDMTSIDNADLTNPLMKNVLIAHLKSDDFFDVEKFPRAHFQLEGAEPIADASPSDPNYDFAGRFTLKGVERPLGFKAQVGRSPERDGGLVARANFDLDRTVWNVRYGSGKFYEKLGKHLVSDLISLDLKIVAR